jgi:hypothetical protein
MPERPLSKTLGAPVAKVAIVALLLLSFYPPEKEGVPCRLS